MCYKNWEAREAPGYYFEGRYHASWHFCPHCGTKWDGPRLTDPDYYADRQIGKRRRKIADAIERRRSLDMDVYYKTPHRDRIAYPGEHFAVFYWLVEALEDGKWSPVFQMEGFRVSARRVLERLREHRALPVYRPAGAEYRLRKIGKTEWLDKYRNQRIYSQN